MKHLIASFTLLILFAFTSPYEPRPDPLDAARQKMAEATSISFKVEMAFLEPYSGDTTKLPAHYAQYLKNNREGFSYDFVYDAGSAALLYRNGRLETVDGENRLVITYSDAEAKEDLASEGHLASMKSPMAMIEDSALVRIEKAGDLVIYEHITLDEQNDEGHQTMRIRLAVDSITSNVMHWERIEMLDGVVNNRILFLYSDYSFNQIDSLTYDYPAGLTSTSMGDIESERMRSTLKPGDTFPHFEVEDIKGKSFSSESTKGKKLVLAFSYIQCAGCAQAQKELLKMDFKFREEYVGVYVNPVDNGEQLRKYQVDKPWPFEMVAVEADFPERYGVYAYPTFIAVDENGIVEEIVSGYKASFFDGKGK